MKPQKQRSESARRFSLSVLIPAFNEQDNIKGTIEEFKKIKKNFGDVEAVIVDDASTDKTHEIALKSIEGLSNIRLIQNKKNRGFGAAYRTAFEHANSQYCILLPGDNSHPAHTLFPIIEKAGMADMIIPYTINKDARSRSRRIISKIFVSLVNLITGLKIPYYNGLVLHRTELLKSAPKITSGFSYQAELIVYLIRNGATFVTVETFIEERASGKSSALGLLNLFKVAKSLAKITFSRR